MFKYTLAATLDEMDREGITVAECPLRSMRCLSLQNGRIVGINTARFDSSAEVRTALIHEDGHFASGAFYLPYSPYQLKAQAAPFSADGFSLAVGAPLLDTPEDCTALSRALLNSLEPPRPDEALVLMGHGSLHHSNGEFLRMEQALRTEGRPDAFVGVMRGEPGLDRVLAAVHRRPHVRAVQLHPLLITAGMHARRDLAGPGDTSWRTRLEAAELVFIFGIAALLVCYFVSEVFGLSDATAALAAAAAAAWASCLAARRAAWRA